MNPDNLPLRRYLLPILLLVICAFRMTAYDVLINFNFQSTTLPAGVTSDGTISPTKAADGVCSMGMIQVNKDQYLQVDVGACSKFTVNMKSTASSARTVRVKYKKQGDADYTIATTNLQVQTAASFDFTALFPAIISSVPISVRIEPTSGNIQVHDLYVEGTAGLSNAAEITAFKIPGQTGTEVINSTAATITIQVPAGTPLVSVVPSVLTISANATINPAAGVSQDFSNGKEVSYTVTAEDGTSKVWKVKVEATGVNTYTLAVSVNGVGEVTLSPAGGQYAEGTVVTLTPKSVLGSVFQSWGGNLSGSSSPATITMNGNRSVTASFTSSLTVDFSKPVGFASVVTTSYPEFNGPTTGGQGAADTLRINGPTDFDLLATHLYNRNRAYKNKREENGAKYAPLVIVLKEGLYPEGTSASSAWGNHMLTIQEQGDLTIIGEKNVVLNFGINVKRSWNILIRNISFQDYYDDGINIGEAETHHIWVDHCTVGHPTTMPADPEHPDGGIDVKAGASYITISWCKYRNSWKTGLVGHSDNNGAEDRGKLKVTYFGNHFYNTNSRNPRTRFGEVHVLNNLEEDVMLYGIAASNESQVYAENNFFLNSRWPMYADRTTADFKIVYGNNTDDVFTSKTGNLPCTALKQVGNEYDDSGLPVITAQINPAMLNPGGRSIKFDEFNAGAIFNPSSYYTYTPYPASVVRTIVPMFAGAGKVDFFTTTPTDPGPGPSTGLPAFPGAEGFGKYATGGRGGKVVAVTNLNDNGPGSFRQAFNEYPGEPITIVFRVAGTIELSSVLKVNRSNITIAGQTAPGDGICLKGNSFIINGGGTGGPKGNIIVRYLRSRPGTFLPTGVYGFDMENCSNVIIDHCSFSWANEECAAMYDTKNVTVQWSIISEGLYDAGHAKGVRSYGGVWGGQNASYHHNLIAHQNSRTVRFNGARAHDTLALIDYRNNVVYNWRSSNACYGGEVEIDNGVSQVNMVNNFYKPGPAFSGTLKFVQASYTASLAKGIGQWYLSGNIMNGNTAMTADNLAGLDLTALPSDADRAFARSAAPFTIDPALPVQSATDAYDAVLANAGAILPRRDAVDARVVQETRTGTATGTGSIGNGIIDNPAGVGGWPVYIASTVAPDADHDGMPDAWETAHGSNPNDENDRNTITASGYTNLENYLNSIAVGTEPLMGVNASFNSFNQLLGSPSPVQTYKAGGSNLTGPVMITAPANYQVSADSSTWNNSSTPLVLTPTAGTINAKIFVRLNAVAAGAWAGNITHTSTGVPAVDLPVTGTTNTITAPINADLVVAKDGSGNYTTLQAAIDAAPTGRTTPFVIYIKNGKYKEKVSIPSNKPFIHLVGESVANTIITWDDYSGKVVNGVTIGTSTSATITISAADCMAANISFENSTGYTGDGPQALAINVSGDRCAFKGCRFIGGQDTVLANGNGKRQYFKNCYIDGNTDFIFGSSIAVFDSCVIFPRDRVDGSNGGYITAANTPPGQAYGYVFRDCQITKNRSVTLYTLGRPWQNDAATADVAKSNSKVVFLNATMPSSVKPEGWSIWDAGTNTSLITYAEYKTKKLDGSLLNTSQRVPWSKQLTDAEAAAYALPAIFGGWDPCTLSPSLCSSQPAALAVSNLRVQRGASQSAISWNLSWPYTDVKYEVYRSADSINFSKINEVSSATDTVVAFSVNDALPVAGTTYYYYVKASRTGLSPHDSYIASVNTNTPLDGEYRSAGSGFWTNAASGNGANTNSIWEKYVASSATWVLQNKGTAPNNVNVTIRSGHTVLLDGLKNVNNLTIETGGVLKSNGGYSTPASQTLRVGAGAAATVVINNNGVLGGDANPDDFITLEFTANCASVLLTGTGTTKITRLRPLYPNPNALAVTFDQDLSLSYNSGGFTAYYNNAANTSTEIVTYTINEGKTVKLTNPAGSFNATPNPTPNPGGKYTYNINGTLDLSVTTATSHAVPFSNNASSVIAINVGTTGTLKLGAGFNTVNSAPGAANGKVVLSIANGGVVDATKTTNLNLGGNYFITEGSGALKRAVGSTPVLFPVGVSDMSYNPATITNTGTADNFAVGVKGSFDHAPVSPLQVINGQWTISEETPGGTMADIKLGWLASAQAPAFDASKPVSLMRYSGTIWENTTATVTGTGTVADPFLASATGFTDLNSFGITNNYPSIATNAALTIFSQITGTPSAAQSFSISGNGLTNNLLLTAPAGYELSINGGTNWNTTLTLNQNNGIVGLTSIMVRLNAATMGAYAGNIKATSTGITDLNIPVNGNAAAGPTLVSTGTLTVFAQTIGGPSAVQTYSIAGTGLTGAVTITPPDNYQISANGGSTWFTKATPLVLAQTAGALNTTTISVRLNAATTGAYAGNIVHTSTGSNTINIPVTGTVVPPPALSVMGTLKAFAQTRGSASVVQTYTISGTDLIDNIRVTPPEGYEVSANGTTWGTTATSLVLTPANGTVNTVVSVRLNAATAGNYSGNITQVTTGTATVTIAVTGTTINAPAVTANNNIRDFSQSLGSPSAMQVVTVSGQYLTSAITVTPPDNYELSLDGITWTGKANPVVLTPATGAVAARNIQVRLNAVALGVYYGTLTIGTNGTAGISIPLKGVARPGFTIYPNPAHNWLTVYHPKRYTIGKLYIYNMKGTSMGVHYTRTAENSTTIDISALPAGIYFVEYRLLNEKVLMKFVKQ